ncbi:hypothetical protein I350_02480 [Cryptococcus amylolentus CBS 6273]|uniref:Uncharacterized protein n=1 Tax=Cryptococcus amylolentus CBS 6273 TaxID=1296118 RepID=A0A1E3KB27_9TREE|nr:hypothetical protein I350_02480 [Cryptococcus amylolentus CBS 6273]
MPPRRRASAKASYAPPPAFSDDEDSDSDDSAGPSARPKSQAKANGKGKGKGKGKAKMDSDESMDSGDGSAFEPDMSEAEAVKEESDPSSASASGSEDGEGSEDDFSRDPSEPPLRSIGSLLPPSAPAKGKNRARESTAKGPKSRSTKANGGKGVITLPQTLSLGEFNSSNTEILAGVPATYIKEISLMSELLARKPQDAAAYDSAKGQSKPKGHYNKVGALPFPHPLPYSTFLKTDPKFGSLPNPPVRRVVGQREGEGGTEKQQRARFNKEAGRLALGVPWEMWRGDVWWPEMFVEGSGGRQGKGKEGDWLAFDDVTLGLQNVGRKKKEDLTFLSSEQAKAYLPSPDEPSITIHVGPRTTQSVVKMKAFDVLPIVETNPIVPQPAFTFYAGGPVTSIDWCPMPASKAAHFKNTQYLAISTLPHVNSSPRMYDRAPPDTRGSIQIWALVPPSHHTPADSEPLDVSSGQGQDGDEDTTMQEGGSAGQGSKGEMDGSLKCVLTLCIRGGSALDIKWMPIGAWDDVRGSGEAVPKLGVLGAVQVDGSISFYAVPHPRALGQGESGEPLHLELDKPLYKLQLEDSMFTCFDWLSGSTIGAGLDNGSVAVYDILPLLSSPNPNPSPPLPILYTSVSSSALSSLTASRHPPHPTQLGSPATMMSVGGWDGSFVLLDTRDGGLGMLVRRQNLPIMCTGWSTFLPGPMMGNLDYNVEITTLGTKSRLMNKGRGTVLGGHKGTVLSLSASVFHPMVMSGSADGSVMMTNQFDPLRRVGQGGRQLESHTIYTLSHSPLLNAYRLTDDHLPTSTPLANLTGKPPKGEPAYNVKHPAWDVSVGVGAVRWNCAGGLGQAGWCASGTGVGIGRVDWVDGRYLD